MAHQATYVKWTVSLGSFCIGCEICCVKSLTEKQSVHAKGPGKIVNLLRGVNAVLDHELPKPNVDAGNQGSIESGLKNIGFKLLASEA